MGIDVGSSSVKVAILDVNSGRTVGSAHYPEQELAIEAMEEGWAEQHPEVWWDAFYKSFKALVGKTGIDPAEIKSIGISYQMHGLVLVDDQDKVLRPSIIWCDSRAVPIGKKAFEDLGEAYCTNNLLNSPGNFTASKLRWVKENEPKIFEKVKHFMLPGDFIAFKLSGEATTTASGISEGVFWDFKQHAISGSLLDYYGIDPATVSHIVPTFGIQCEVSDSIAKSTGLKKGTPIAYRAGDQPNNAFSLNVLNPGEVASTAGTSGVIYAVTDKNIGDPESRVNTFLHVNNGKDAIRNGILLCINGTGILNSWLKHHLSGGTSSYEEMNQLAATIPAGAGGLHFFPFGNGAERVLKNKYPKATLEGLDLNRHNTGHVLRAAQEGIVFALKYGFDVLQEMGVKGNKIRAGKANMFLSPVFRKVFCNTVGAQVELYNTDGAEGAARGAAYGAGLYSSLKETFSGLELLQSIEPDKELNDQYEEIYHQWKSKLDLILEQTA